MVDSPFFADIPQIAYGLASTISKLESKLSLPLVGLLDPLAQHFFVRNPTVGGTGVDPRFNLADSTSYSTLAKTAVSHRDQGIFSGLYAEFITILQSLNSPDGSDNIAWLELTNVAGSLAESAFRMNTVKGQPPTSCNAPSSQVESVPYAAFYCTHCLYNFARVQVLIYSRLLDLFK